jgi:hypothetical protein
LATAQKDSTATTGFVDLNAYNDTRHFGVYTINLMANIHNRVQYFSFVNFQGAANSTDLGTFFTEQNIRIALKKKSPIDLTLQYVIRNNIGNDDLKLGLRFKLSQTKPLVNFFKKLNMFYSINPMFVQFQEKMPSKYMTQIEHVYSINILPQLFNKRVYISGFADQNFVYDSNNNLKFKWITEHQLGIKVIDNFYVVAEWRLNNYVANQRGLGYGIEYKIIY